MDGERLTIAVTGLNATDNPGPGVAVIRALREAPGFAGRIVGLAYDTLEPGIYARDLVPDVFLLPYPSQGIEALEARLRYIHGRIPLDAVIPTLDSELPSFIALEGTLSELGIGTFLPTREQFDLRAKAGLPALGERAGILVPASRVVTDVEALYGIHREIPYPLYVKGLFYGAALACSVDEAVQAFHRVVAQWGLPVIVQTRVDGEELDVVALGDGRGGLVGALPMRKTWLTDKGKGWAGVAIRDPELEAMAVRFMAATRWRGPCELEVMRDRQDRYHLLEVNPRFPAWVYLAAGAGLNLPWATALLATGREPPPLGPHRVGTMFVRISLDQIADIADFERMATAGELGGGGRTG
ncbi:MAG: ATP-grasp domain-containing protein [Deltaproteobacteria bacterium]|nr:ATP-grasp domain-containing protein [Deltaproteobacteria bacterium]